MLREAVRFGGENWPLEEPIFFLVVQDHPTDLRREAVDKSSKSRELGFLPSVDLN